MQDRIESPLRRGALLAALFLAAVALCGLGLWLVPRAGLAAEAPAPVYSTIGGVLEVDTCASAWVIRRFVEPRARFRFFEARAAIDEGIEFDTPTARDYARRPGLSIMETVIERNELGEDTALQRVSRIVRDIELNKWGDRFADESAGIEAVVTGINRISEDEDEVLEKTFVVFDALYARFGQPDESRATSRPQAVR